MFSVSLYPFPVQNLLLIKAKKISKNSIVAIKKNADFESVVKVPTKKVNEFCCFSSFSTVGQSFWRSNFLPVSFFQQILIKSASKSLF
jgi:hypothetical protein